MSDKRFIEESFPVKEVSVESAKEKSISHGHISTLHVWWARRPLASSRATNYAALTPATDDIDDWQKTRQFIIDFSKWKNSLSHTMIQKARQDILKANGGKPPKVLDPFAGGGAIPLEALRLGCETYSSDLNPVSVLIQKCTLEYPHKYGKRMGNLSKRVVQKSKATNKKNDQQAILSVYEESTDYNDNPLLADVKIWGNWVSEEARKEIGQFYPPDRDGSVPVGYIWARTIPCQNPACGAEIPLMRQYWLAKKDKKEVSLFPHVEKGNVHFKVVGTGYEKIPSDFDPEYGTVSRAVVNCLVCGTTVDDETTRRLFQEGNSGERLVAVLLHKPGQSGKRYRVATKKDVQISQASENYLHEKREKLLLEWGIDPIPDELLPPKETLGFRVQRYGMLKWGDLFNARQQLALITLAEKVKQCRERMAEEGHEANYANAVITYLGILLSRLSNRMSRLAYWYIPGEKIQPTFVRQALAMVWDYVEMNPFSESSGSWKHNMFDGENVLKHLVDMNTQSPANVTQSSATSLPYIDNFFDAVLTDPPYYDNVPYSHLSDFFYVWLKRTVGDLHPELFSTPLTPKKNEIVAYSHKEGGVEKGKQLFEAMLKQSFQEIHRVLKPDGIAVIVYAHKSIEGWETLINSLLDSGLIMTGAWPLHTEMQTRLRAQESATLASSIYIVARKMNRQQTGFYNEVKEELKKYLNQKLERLWQEGVGGTDFFIAAIGSSIEVFGKYEQVMDYEGNVVRADRMLEDVRKMATEYAVRQILHNGFAGEISDMTRLYVLYRWNYGSAKVLFDEARKLAQSCSIDLSKEWSHPGFIRKEKEFIRVLGPEDRDIADLKKSVELVDVLHRVLLLWEKGKRTDMIGVLQESGYGHGEAFYRVAQAISETLPAESKEKKLLDGFLAGRERLKEEIKGKPQIGIKQKPKTETGELFE